jgi:hypothetical protein
MNTIKIFCGLMAAGMIVISTFAVEAQRLTREDLIRIKSGKSAQIITSPVRSKKLDVQTTKLQSDGSVATNKKTIIGSWLETVTFSGPDPNPPLKSMSTFTADGGLTVADQGSVAADVVFTPGHGAWKYLSDGTFAWTVLEIIYDPVTGSLIGYLKVNGEYTVDESGNAYSGQFLAEISDPGGDVLFTVEGTNEGTRISVEALP